jgi:Icc protein
VANLGSSTPIVVFAHIPLWSVYPAWGWGTEDSAQALTLLKRFGAVTVLNGHIHQTMQKTEGHVIFHTAMSTAFPQPAPGSAPSPGPMKVPADTLREVLGINSVQYVEHGQSLAVVGFSLEGALPAQSSHGDGQDNVTTQGSSVSIANFTFDPKELHVDAGSTVTWTNHDDMPHTVLSTTKLLSSPVLDTDQKYSFTFKDAGVYDYICSIHRQMSGRIIVGK